jgi:hypothetical protein
MTTKQDRATCLRLVRYFSVTAFIIMSAAAAVLALGYKLVVETQLIDQASRSSVAVFGSICVLMLLVYGALLVVVQRGATLIRRQQDALHAAHAQLVAAKEAAEGASRAKSAFLADIATRYARRCMASWA